MGAGASSTVVGSTLSIEDIGKWSKEEVGEQVAAIGHAFEAYKEVVLNEDIDGRTLLDLDDEDLEEYGVNKKVHRKKIRQKLGDLKAAATASEVELQKTASTRTDTVDDGGDDALQIFMSYPRGEQTTRLTRLLATFLKERGFRVWMDEEGIRGGADFMSAIGDAIKASRGMVAIIDEKFCGSTYCNNELAMAQGNGLQLFPILFRDMSFDRLPNGLQYMLASTNVITFPDEASDTTNMQKLSEHMSSVLAVSHKTGQCRHGAVQNDAEASAGTPLAAIPMTVPDPPDVLCERHDVLSGMISSLLGFMSTGAVSLSSVKQKSKLSSHGSGGVGKTTLAAMLVRHDLVQRSFDRIAWVTVGQTPDILVLQCLLFEQLTGKDLEAKPGVTPEKQLGALKEASVGKRWLVVLDDVWDSAHEKLLNCIDVKTQSKLFVTTRIRGLLHGCDELSLDLLTRDEAVDLVLRTGGVDSTDEARAAAERIAELCGNLPLFINICGSIIADYEGASEWQVELIEMLQADRWMVMDAANDQEGQTAHRIVGTSLAMLKNEAAGALFEMLCVCPEDVPIPMEAAALIWKACLPEQAAKVNAVTVRKACKLLLDRNLLKGSTANGVYFHDTVRDYMRSKFDGECAIRQKQQHVVNAIMTATPDQDWRRNTALGSYVHQSLKQHMVEAMPEGDSKGDSTVASWLSASERVLNSIVVRTAANLVGTEGLEAMAGTHEAAGEYQQAALRLVSAANTEEMPRGMGDLFDVELHDRRADLLLRASTLLDLAQGLNDTVRTLHVTFIGKLLLDRINDERLRMALIPKLKGLLEAGASTETAEDSVQIALACFGLMQEGLGIVEQGAGNHLVQELQIKAGREYGHTNVASYRQAYEIAVRDDLDMATRCAMLILTHWPVFWSWPYSSDEFTNITSWYTHAHAKEIVDNYDLATVHPKVCQFIGMDMFLNHGTHLFGLICHGDIALLQRHVRKMADMFQDVDDWKTVPSFVMAPMVVQSHSGSILAQVGTDTASLALLAALDCSFDDVGATMDHVHTCIAPFASWHAHNDNGDFCLFHKSLFREFAVHAKAAHWCHAPDTIDREKRCALLSDFAQVISAADYADDFLYEMSGSVFGRADVIRVMESIERYEDAVTEALRWLKSHPWHKFHIIEAHRAIGRCQAKLGRTEEADAAFKTAIAEAAKWNFTYLEMLVHCDYIHSVLDPAGRRDQQLALLGKTIKALVLEPGVYNGVLSGYGLDSSTAVAAYDSVATSMHSKSA